ASARSASQGTSVVALPSFPMLRAGTRAPVTPPRSRLPACGHAGQICEGFLGRTEPGLEVAPLIDRIGIEGPANLVGTHRLDHSLGLVEAQALLLERQIAVSEQSAYLALEIGDQILVLHAMDAPRQHAVKVPHQMHIVAVVAAEILEVVGKPGAGLKMLLEIGEAAGERPTARVDDLRIRQEQ